MAIPTRPIGTIKELEAMRLHPASYPSCALKKQGEVEGCPMWNLCSLEEKQRTGPAPKDWNHEKRNWEGPVNLGVRFLKPVFTRGVGANQEPMPCYVYFQLRNQLRANGGLMQIVAHEGEEISTRVSKKVAPDNDPGAPVGSWLWKSDKQKIVVPRHPRPSEMPELEAESFLAELLKQDEVASEAAHEHRLIGASKNVRNKPDDHGSAASGGS